MRQLVIAWDTEDKVIGCLPISSSDKHKDSMKAAFYYRFHNQEVIFDTIPILSQRKQANWKQEWAM